MTKRITGWMLAAALTMGASAMVAQRYDDHHNGRHDNGNHNGWNNNNNHGNNYRDYHFGNNDRNRWASHYSSDIRRYQRNPRLRHNYDFRRGGRIPAGVRFRAVPSSYYRGMAPLPPGYRYGYYDGYVVAYDPTTQIIADVMDLVASAAR